MRYDPTKHIADFVKYCGRCDDETWWRQTSPNERPQYVCNECFSVTCFTIPDDAIDVWWR